MYPQSCSVKEITKGLEAPGGFIDLALQALSIAL